MNDWMDSLAEHYGRCRAAHPDDRLLIIFDIDGTILDMRHMVRYVLIGYDRAHNTDHFAGLRVDDIDVHENQVERFLERSGLAATLQTHVHQWYLDRRWTPAAVLEAHRPFQGVMEVIRWFQLQPSTFVGLNTGRPASLRAETLRSLNALGREYRVSFADQLLQMNPGGWSVDVTAPKVAGLRAFMDAGYRVLAVVDNEPENIEAMVAADMAGEVLFLHAQTFYETRRAAVPRTVGGSVYDLRGLIGERDLPRHVQLVWHGVNDPANLRQFLASTVRWGEMDIRADLHGGLVLCHDPVEATTSPQPQQLSLGDGLAAVRDAGKGAKLDIKEPESVEPALAAVRRSGLGDDDLWFNGRIDVLGEAGFRRLATVHPGSIVQCPVDFLGPLAVAVPAQAELVIDTLVDWGVNRFSLSWSSGHVRALLDRLDEWGYDANIYAVPDLEQFLRAALLLPRSITADFNFPEWHYFGRGAGQRGRYHRYRMDALAAPATDVA